MGLGWVPMKHQAYSDTSTVGNAFLGTQEKGIKFFDLAKHLAAFVDEVKKFDIATTNPHTVRQFQNADWFGIPVTI